MEINVATILSTDTWSDHSTSRDPIEKETDVGVANRNCATKTRSEEKIDSMKYSELMAQHKRDRLKPGIGDKIAKMFQRNAGFQR